MPILKDNPNIVNRLIKTYQYTVIKMIRVERNNKQDQNNVNELWSPVVILGRNCSKSYIL